MSEFLQYGGQAVIEGVMMRSPRFFAVACRKPDNTIVVRAEPVENSFIGRLKWLNRPFLRGSLALLDAMALGTRALSYSAQVQADGLARPTSAGEALPGGTAPSPALQKSTTTRRINDIAIGATMAVAFLFGLGLFVALPTLLTQLSQSSLGIRGSVALNLTDGIVRIAIFLGYIAVISRMENIRRVFQYHGAEHKAINTLEAGGELTTASCMKASRIHPRCGTSFIIVVLLASILVHSVFPRPEQYFARVALHLALIPVVAGVAYEVIRFAGRFRRVRLLSVLLAPGLWTQRLTTREPDASQVEVALQSLNAVLALERGEGAPAVEAVPAASVA